jgi:hypothetical protein
MSTALQEASPITLRAFLLDRSNDADSSQALAELVEQQGLARASLSGARRLSTSAVRAVDHEVGTTAADLLTMDLGDILASGWQKYSALTDAARRTRQVPDRKEVLALASHRVACAYTPRVDLFVDTVRVNTFEFDLTVTFDITGLAAIIVGGNLIAVTGGDCVVTGTFALEGAVLARRRRHFDPHVILPLHRPLGLWQSADPVPPRQRLPSEAVHDATIGPG